MKQALIRSELMLILLLAPLSAAGQLAEPLITDRPDFTESSMSVAGGVLQLEAGYTFASVSDVSSHSFGEVLLRLGLGGPLEFRLGLNSYIVSTGNGGTQDGLEDLSLGAKVELIEGSGMLPALGLIAAVTVPTGADSFSSNSTGADLVLAAGWDVGSQWSVGSNVGFLGGVLNDGSDNQWLGSFVVGRTVSARGALFGEVYGFSAASADADIFIDGGVTFALNEHFQLDLRLARQVSGVERETHLGVGVAHRWQIIR